MKIWLIKNQNLTFSPRKKTFPKNFRCTNAFDKASKHRKSYAKDPTLADMLGRWLTKKPHNNLRQIILQNCSITNKSYRSNT